MTTCNADSCIAVGLMSGTSLDGISASAVRFRERDGLLSVELLSHLQVEYSSDQRERLADLMQRGSSRDYCRLNADLGEWFAQAALEVISNAGLDVQQVGVIASHGQTLWHEPGHSTWQIGDASRIAEKTGCAVVSDFRSRDVAAGGQGAPLVPIADIMLFSHTAHWRAMQNLGGIGNVTLVPPSSAVSTTKSEPELSEASASQDNPCVLAFDTGPGVVVLNGVTQRLFSVPFDRDGVIAAGGRVLPDVARAFLAMPYFNEKPPKSTGRELFSPAFIDQFVARCMDAGGSSADAVATAGMFTALTIADQYFRWLPRLPDEIVVSGGGAKNPHLLACISDAFSQYAAGVGQPAVRVYRFDDLFFDAEAKEAVAFALHGYLHLHGRAGNVPSATGARAPRILGAMIPASRV